MLNRHLNLGPKLGLLLVPDTQQRHRAHLSHSLHGRLFYLSSSEDAVQVRRTWWMQWSLAARSGQRPRCALLLHEHLLSPSPSRATTFLPWWARQLQLWLPQVLVDLTTSPLWRAAWLPWLEPLGRVHCYFRARRPVTTNAHGQEAPTLNSLLLDLSQWRLQDPQNQLVGKRV